MKGKHDSFINCYPSREFKEIGLGVKDSECKTDERFCWLTQKQAIKLAKRLLAFSRLKL